MHLERTVCSNLLFQRRDLSLEDLFSWSYINRKGYHYDIASLILIWQGQPHYHSMALEMTYTTWDSEHHIYVYDTLGRVVCCESQNFRVLLLLGMTMIWINEQRSQNGASYLCCPQSVMYQKHSILYVGHVEVQNKLVNLLPSLSGVCC